GHLPDDEIALAEPRRSYLAALSLLGTRIPCSVARAFLADFLFTGSLDELLIDGLTSIESDAFVLARNLSHLVPEASRAALYRVAAEKLESLRWTSAEETMRVLRDFPRHALTPKLADTLTSALIDCGRYSEARAITTNELLIAKCERRTGDYASALDRLERMPWRDFDA